METGMGARLSGALLGVAALLLAAGTAGAADVKLPDTMAWTAYDTGSAGHAHAVAMGKAFKEKYGINLRVLPGKNDVSRLRPLQAGKVEAVANGVGTYFAQEGVFEFDRPDWGPQDIRIVLSATGGAGLMVGVAADAGVKEYKDLRGKRVAWVKGAPSLNHNVTAILAFGGLTWNDVQKVEFAGYGASWEAMTSNQVDAAFAITNSGSANAVAASPRGLMWPPLPHADAEGWKRLNAVAPYMAKHVITAGISVDKNKPIEGTAYPYPILTVRGDASDDLVYNLTKAVVESLDAYKDGAPGAGGWALDAQVFEWAVPYHPGTIKYLKEIGRWTDAYQKHNDGLMQRQKVLKDAWAAFKKDAPSDENAFGDAWGKARVAALKAAGMNPVIE